MKQLVSIVWLSLISAAANSAPVTIDFEEYSGSVSSLDPVLADTSVGNGFLLSPGVGSPKWLNGIGPGSVTVGLSTNGTSIVFDRDDGLTFNLLNFDWDAGANGNYSFTLSGTTAGGGTPSLFVAVTELASGTWTNFSDTALFQDLTMLTITTGPATGVGLVVDNFSVNVVPIPAALWLFGPALAGLGFLRRHDQPGS